jgi:two-component system phosphate regulon sensor histidine kinase PhoR
MRRRFEAAIWLPPLAGGAAGLVLYGAARLAGAAVGPALAGLVAGAWMVWRVLDLWFSRRPPPPLREQPATDAAASPVDVVPLSALGQAAILTDGWRIIATNAAASDLFGGRLGGSDLRQMVRHPAVSDAVAETMAGGQPAMRSISTLGQREGEFELRVARAGGNRVLLLFADISREWLAERMRADFVANASHELRTPLANIMGFIETLQGPATGDPAAAGRFLDIMAREAARMARLIDDLLSLSRIELDRYVRPQSAIELGPLVAEVVRSFSGQAAADDRTLIVDLADDLPPVRADHDQILQVLYNLLSNALKYGRRGTPVQIAAHRAFPARGDPQVAICIRDEGDGIAPEHLPRLTERFYRADTGRSRQLGGTGLGLAIVRRIIDRHRGQLRIESTPGQGTLVTVLLPVAGEAVTEAA